MPVGNSVDLRADVRPFSMTQRAGTRLMLGFNTFRCARIVLADMGILHMITKGQMKCTRAIHPSVAVQFYSRSI